MLCATNYTPAESSRDSGEKRLLRFLKGLDCQLTRNRGELPQKLTQRMAALDVVHQVLERNPRAAKTRRAVHDIRVDKDCGVRHFVFHCIAQRGSGLAPLSYLVCEKFKSLHI